MTGQRDDPGPPAPAPDADAALGVWAVTADALARGEQIFVLLPGGPGGLRDLDHEAFWIHPVWDAGDPRHLTEPYQDRLRALEELRHDDGRIRLKYRATAEYLDRLAVPESLRPLDGEHTLNFGGVRALFDASPGGRVGLLVLRVHERAETAVLTGDGASRREPWEGRWISLPEPVPVGRTDPVVVYSHGPPRKPAEVSFLLGRLNGEALTRVRLIVPPEIRQSLLQALAP